MFMIRPRVPLEVPAVLGGKSCQHRTRALTVRVTPRFFRIRLARVPGDRPVTIKPAAIGAPFAAQNSVEMNTPHGSSCDRTEWN